MFTPPIYLLPWIKCFILNIAVKRHTRRLFRNVTQGSAYNLLKTRISSAVASICPLPVFDEIHCAHRFIVPALRITMITLRLNLLAMRPSRTSLNSTATACGSEQGHVNIYMSRCYTTGLLMLSPLPKYALPTLPT